MQKGVRVVLSPLFLCTLFGIISMLYTSLALWDSVLSSPLAISNSGRKEFRWYHNSLEFLTSSFQCSYGAENSSIRRTVKLLKLKPGTKRDFLIKGIYKDVHKFTPTQDIEPTTSTRNPLRFGKKRKELFKAKPSKNPKSDNFEPSDQTSTNTLAQSDTEDLT